MSEISSLNEVLDSFHAGNCIRSDSGRDWCAHVPLYRTSPWLALDLIRCQVEDEVEYTVRCCTEKGGEILKQYVGGTLSQALLKACVDLYVRGSFDLDGCGNWAPYCADAAGGILERLAENRLKSGD